MGKRKREFDERMKEMLADIGLQTDNEDEDGDYESSTTVSKMKSDTSD